jgi:hypothetical protein
MDPTVLCSIHCCSGDERANLEARMGMCDGIRLLKKPYGKSLLAQTLVEVCRNVEVEK